MERLERDTAEFDLNSLESKAVDGATTKTETFVYIYIMLNVNPSNKILSK